MSLMFNCALTFSGGTSLPFDCISWLNISISSSSVLTFLGSTFEYLSCFFNIPTDEDDADAKEKQDKYSKVDPKNVKTLEDEIEMFSQLMQS